VGSKKSYGLFILGVPVLENAGGVFFREPKFTRTISSTRNVISKPWIIARSRKKWTEPGSYPPLDKVGAELVMTLPDYGVGGWRGLYHLLIFLFSPRVQKRLRTHMEAASFVYAGVPSLEAYLAARICKKIGRRLIIELRGSALLDKQYMRSRFGIPGHLLRLVYQRQLTFICKQSRAALYVSHSLQQEYPLETGVQAVVPDVYLPESFSGEPRIYRRPAASYLYVGHLELVKRVDLLLKALHIARVRLPEGWHFDIVGSGPQRNTLEKLAANLGLIDRVSFHGRVRWGNPLAAFYEQSDLFLMASITEGASRVLMEAMAFGLPAVSTAAGTAPDLLEEETIVPDPSPDAYTDCLLRLVHDPRRLTRHSEQNWRKAQAFSAARIQEKRRAFWQQVINKP
jgi:glycosyltransferase involved in cell wall biosynthesis